MKWVLVTNYTASNPGDEWARVGVEEVIKAVDRDPRFIYVERDHGTEITRPVDYDIAVVCSMPGIWSHQNENGTENSTRTHHSWNCYLGWLSEKPLILAGYGVYVHCKNWPGPFGMYRQEEVVSDVKTKLFPKCALVYSRDGEAAKELFGPDTLTMPCPSVLARMRFEHLPHAPDLDLCNLMPHGGHYASTLNKDAAEQWSANVKSVGEWLRKNGFLFVAHSKPEFEFATGVLGFKSHECFLRASEYNLMQQAYFRCRRYFGNRIHGAIVARSFGAKVLCCGSDTRLGAVQMVGGDVCTPATLIAGDFARWTEDQTPGEPFNLWEIFQDTVQAFQNVVVRIVTKTD